jgi:serine/threonine protein kinase
VTLPIVRDHQLETLLHHGATSEVWRASRLGPNGFAVPVALKTLNEASAGAQDLVRSFLKESRAASSVQHRNVVQVRELICCDQERYWLSMELVSGWSMRELLAVLTAADQRLPIPVALSLVRDAVRGVQAVHEAGLVHRNIAPDNLMLTHGGHLVVLDFGFATWQHSQRIRFVPPVESLDLRFSSPDMIARLPVDARTDVFSLGALLHHLIPARGNAPLALDAIIERALEPEAARRFPSAQALETALDLVSIREGWLVPPSYVSAYLHDVFRASMPSIPRVAEGSSPGTEIGTPVPEERPPTSSGRAVLPRGRHGMVGVGAMLAAAARPPSDLAWCEVSEDEDDDDDPYLARSPAASQTSQTSPTVTLVRVRRS